MWKAGKLERMKSNLELRNSGNRIGVVPDYLSSTFVRFFG